MYKIALLDNENFVTEIQEVADLKDTILALMLSADDYVEITGVELPAVESGYKLKYDKESKLFILVEHEELEAKPYQPTNAEVAQMISDLQADLIIAGVI